MLKSRSAVFTRNLLCFLRQAQNSSTLPFTAVQTVKIGDGVVVVQDSLGGYDTYFDAETWRPVGTPELKTEELQKEAFPPTLAQYKMGTINGVFVTPPVRSIEDAIPVARRHLVPVNGARWHEPSSL